LGHNFLFFCPYSNFAATNHTSATTTNQLVYKKLIAIVAVLEQNREKLSSYKLSGVKGATSCLKLTCKRKKKNVVLFCSFIFFS